MFVELRVASEEQTQWETRGACVLWPENTIAYRGRNSVVEG